VNKIIPFHPDGQRSDEPRPSPARISQYAVVDPKAEIDSDVEIGPFCVIGPDVRIGRGTVLQNHVTILGRTTIGQNNRFYAGAVIGNEPQDLSFKGSDTQVIIGNGNLIRECVTINRASEKEDGITRVGNDCFIMANCHIAHDCSVGNNVVIANAVIMGGHVHIHDYVTLAGGVGVHHFASVGKYAFIGALSLVAQDVAPYMLAAGNPARSTCPNLVALKRRNFPTHVVRAISDAHRLLYRSRVGLAKAREILEQDGQLYPEVQHMLDFIQESNLGRNGRSRDRRRNVA
jgi:UDP-N-acetylglucosamine acyltransferase